jgi:hypothetical protein
MPGKSASPAEKLLPRSSESCGFRQFPGRFYNRPESARMRTISSTNPTPPNG